MKSSTFYCLSLTSGKARPSFTSFNVKTLNEALIALAKNLYPKESFDGVNHLKMFLGLKFKDIKVENNYVYLSDKTNEIMLSNDLPLVLEKLSEPFDASQQATTK
jgi:hypothetical protein